MNNLQELLGEIDNSSNDIDKYHFHRSAQIVISLSFQTVYLLLYVYVAVFHFKPIWHSVLKTLKKMIWLFSFFLVIDFVGVLITLILILTGKVSRKIGYEFQLTLKLLIRRFSLIVFFKFLFQMKRVELQMSRYYKTIEECLKGINRLVRIERSYIVFSCLCLVNIAMLIFMFVQQDYF